MTAIEIILPCTGPGGSTRCLKRKQTMETKFSFQSQVKHMLSHSQSMPIMSRNGMGIESSRTKPLQPSSDPNPQSCLEKIFHDNGQVFKIHSCNDLVGFFSDLKQEEVDAYGFDVLRAVRESDITALRKYHQEGRPLKCSNRFGESLLHLACRKALVPVVDFLINEAEVPLCVKDDMGRSPLADAFWTIEPNTELVEIILRKCPDLLLVSDKRGHTPLAYARKHHWAQWNAYLEEKSPEMLLPKSLNR